MEAPQPPPPMPLLPNELNEEQKNIKLQLETQRENYENDILDIESQAIEQVKEVIPKVHKNKWLNIVIYGPEKCGKTTVAHELAKHHKWCVVNLNEIKEWNIEHNTQAGIEIDKYFKEKAAIKPEWEAKEAKIKKRDEA